MDSVYHYESLQVLRELVKNPCSIPTDMISPTLQSRLIPRHYDNGQITPKEKDLRHLLDALVYLLPTAGKRSQVFSLSLSLTPTPTVFVAANDDAHIVHAGVDHKLHCIWTEMSKISSASSHANSSSPALSSTVAITGKSRFLSQYIHLHIQKLKTRFKKYHPAALFCTQIAYDPEQDPNFDLAIRLLRPLSQILGRYLLEQRQDVNLDWIGLVNFFEDLDTKSNSFTNPPTIEAFSKMEMAYKLCA